jgi:hypothetical protein
MNKLVSEHVPIGGNVLVAGAGAGGDVIGALDAGCNVVAVESNKMQYSYLQATLQKEIQAQKLNDEEALLALGEEEVPGTQPPSSQIANSSQQAPLNSQAAEPALEECVDCGEKTAASGVLQRECNECEYPGPLCDKCSVQVPGQDVWLCQTHAPEDLAPTQPSEDAE